MLLMTVMAFFQAAEMKTTILYVSTEGDDSWSGRLPEPNADRTDGPFATLKRARDEIRRLKSEGKLEGFAEKSARQLYEAIQNSKKARLDRFLYALGIRHVGEHVALVIARHFKTLDKLRKASKDDLLEIREIGPEIADSVVNFFREEENERVLDQLLKACLLYTSPSPRDLSTSRMPSSA